MQPAHASLIADARKSLVHVRVSVEANRSLNDNSCYFQVAGIDTRWSSKPVADKLAVCMTDVYTSLQAALPPTLHPHYLLSPRHLSCWVCGLQRYSLQGTNLLQASNVFPFQSLACARHDPRSLYARICQ